MSIGTNKQTETDRLANLAELETLNPNAPDKDDEDVGDDEAITPPEGDESSEKPPVVVESSETPPPTKDAEPPAATSADKPDYEKKFADSTREAQLLLLRNKKYQEKIDAAENLPDPTDEECLAEFGDAWDERDDIDKGLAREALKNKRYRSIIKSVHQEQKAEEEYYSTATAFAVKPEVLKQFPSIEGREEEFGRFASKESRRGLDLEDVAAIFVTSRPVRVVPKGSMTERSNANSVKSKPAPTTLDVNRASILRQTSQKAYAEAIKNGTFDPRKIDFGN